MSIFKPRTTQVNTDPGPAPTKWIALLSAWIQGACRAEGFAYITLDHDANQIHYPGVIVPVVGTPASRWAFTLPPNTQNTGGWLYVQSPDCAPYAARCVVAPNIQDIALLPAQAPWPDPPTRDEACTVQIPFQGFTSRATSHGAFPAFGPETSSLSDADLQAYFDEIHADSARRLAQGLNPWTHVEFAVSWNYRSASYQYPIPGRDLSQNLGELRRRIALAIRAGFKICLFCAGDGLGAGPGYNDPVGWTYGREWLLANFQRIYDAMGPTADSPSCRPFIVFLPGYDGTDSYGWDNPENVIEWWQLARRVIDAGGEGYLGQEWSIGHCQLGGKWDGSPTYINGPAQALDVILQEFPASCPMPTADPDAVFQMLGRMIRPYNRPPEQPSDDDPTPPFYMGQGTPRGRYYYCAYEYGTYQWVRGQISAAQVELDRTYLKRCGCTIVC